MVNSATSNAISEIETCQKGRVIWKERKSCEEVETLKKFFMLVCVLGLLVMLGACTQNEAMADGTEKEPIAFIEREDFSEKEQDFIEAYNEIVTANDIPDQIVSAPDNIIESDFGIILLDAELYGTPAFSFLPIESRKLTEIELKQLAAAYHKAAPEVILQDYSSYKEGSTETRLVNANRRLTMEEDFKNRISIFSEYMTDGKRPEKKDLQNQANGELLCFTYLNRKVWVYPKTEMSDEQILYMIDKSYEELPKEYYTPKDGQLSSKDAKDAAKELMKEYITKEKIEDMYLTYQAERKGLGLHAFPDCWKANIHLKGDYDYSITFDAVTGELLEWKRYAKNFFSTEGFSVEALKNSDKTVPNVTDDQLIETAKQYVKDILRDELTDQALKIKVNSNEVNQIQGSVDMTVKQKNWTVYIDKNDLQIWEMRKVE